VIERKNEKKVQTFWFGLSSLKGLFDLGFFPFGFGLCSVGKV
jgi:hypothetical protein